MDTNEIFHAHQHAEMKVTPEEVQQAYQRMAAAISQDLRDSNLLVVVVLNGGLIPAGQLLPKLDFMLEVTYLHASRYRNTTSGHDLQWFAKPKIDIKGRNVLIVDDIFDEGHTLKAIQAYCHEEGVASLHTAVLVNKLHDRKAEGVSVDYVGLEVEDYYIYGEGMDYKGYFRNLPGLYKATIY